MTSSPPTTIPKRRGAYAAIAVMLLGALAPFLLGIDRLGWGPASHQFEWSATIRDRVVRHVRTIEMPKVIFIGGSSIAFGIHADSLSARLGRPVVAFGLNAGIGIDLIVRDAATLIAPGDTVIFAPEGHHFTPAAAIDPALRGDWLERYGNEIDDPLGRFPLRQWTAARERSRRLHRGLESMWGTWIRRWLGPTAPPRAAPPPPSPRRPHTPYELASIDDRGNIVFRRPRPARTIVYQPPPADPGAYDLPGSRGAASIRTLAAACKERGAVLFVMPAFRAPSRADTPEYTAALVERDADILRLAASLGVPSLLKAGQTVVAPRFVYDTTFHLNDQGVKFMEDRLVEALTPLLPSR